MVCRAPAATAETRRYPQSLNSPLLHVQILFRLYIYIFNFIYSQSVESLCATVVTQCQAWRCLSKLLKEASLFTSALLSLTLSSTGSVHPPVVKPHLPRQRLAANLREGGGQGKEVSAAMMLTEERERDRNAGRTRLERVRLDGGDQKI